MRTQLPKASTLTNSNLRVPIRSDRFALSIQVRSHLCHRRTEFQTIDVYDTEAFGRILTLDGHIQLTELDERVYHEFLVHPALLAIPEPTTALVIGGGDGGVLRELCRHETIRQIDMAEIDAGVIEESRTWVPFVSNGAFEDPRVHVHVVDAFDFVRQATERYDLIVADSTDVYEEEDGGLSEQLFSEAFYRDCLRALSPRGIVVTQADNPVFCPYSVRAIEATFRAVFAETGTYQVPIPSFGGYSAYCWGSAGSRILAEYPREASLPSGLMFLNMTAYESAMLPLSFRACWAERPNKPK